MNEKRLVNVKSLVALTLAALMSLAAAGAIQAGRTSHSASPSEVLAAKKSLAKIAGPNGTFQRPPTSGPRPASGKNIYVVSYGQAVPYFAETTRVLELGAKKLNWELHIWDGKFQPNLWLAGVRQAVSAKADGIIGLGLDCPTIKAGLLAAQKAHIPYISIEGFDCNVLKAGAPKLFTWTVSYVEGSLNDWVFAAGKYGADWAIVNTNGRAKVLNFVETDAYYFRAAQNGFLSELKKCSTCSILDSVTFTGADYGPALQQKAQQALLKNPSTNIVFTSGAEAILDSGVGAAMRTSRTKALATGVEGDLLAPAQFKSGILGMVENIVPGWESYAALNGLIRVFAGKNPQHATGIGLRLVDKQHNYATFKPYQGPIDYQAYYDKTWGVK